MKESERLTVYIAGYAHGYGFIGGTPPRRTKNVCRGKFDATFCVDRLAAYEDTGLSPEEVEKLKAENAELRAKVEGTPNLEFQIGDIAYVVEFAFSDGYDEQDEMTHDVKFYVCQKRLDTESERLHACGNYLEQKAFKSKKAAEEAAEARLKELEANE